MEWRILSDIPDFQLSETVNADDKNDLLNAIATFIEENAFEAITKLYDECPVSYDALFSIRKTERLLHAFAVRIIKERYSDFFFTCTAKTTRKVRLSELLLRILSNCWTETMTSEPIIGQYIEKHLYDFCEESTWHMGLKASDGTILEDAQTWPLPVLKNGLYRWSLDGKKLSPIIWFGPDGVPPLSKFTIWDESKRKNITQGVEAHWSLCDTWEVMAALLEDADEAFLTWYCGECEYWAPHLEEVQHKCPVRFNKYSTTKGTRRAVHIRFVDQYIVAHCDIDDFEIMAAVYCKEPDAVICTGIGFCSSDTPVSDIENYYILERIGEAFVEDYYDFEDGVRQAKKLSDNGMDHMDALHKVFGKFEIFYECSIPELELEFDLDNDALNAEMYQNVNSIYIE